MNFSITFAILDSSSSDTKPRKIPKAPFFLVSADSFLYYYDPVSCLQRIGGSDTSLQLETITIVEPSKKIHAGKRHSDVS